MRKQPKHDQFQCFALIEHSFRSCSCDVFGVLEKEERQLSSPLGLSRLRRRRGKIATIQRFKSKGNGEIYWKWVFLTPFTSCNYDDADHPTFSISAVTVTMTLISPTYPSPQKYSN